MAEKDKYTRNLTTVRDGLKERKPDNGNIETFLTRFSAILSHILTGIDLYKRVAKLLRLHIEFHFY